MTTASRSAGGSKKHNSYASREAVDLLNLRHGFLPILDAPPANRTAAIKRWLKIRVYAWLPGGIRAGLYFFYRYLICAGCLDGKLARRFHVLQGFWYRYLVDAKLADVQRCMRTTGADAPEAIEVVLGIDVTSSGKTMASKAA